MRTLPAILLTLALLRPAAADDAEPTWRGKTAFEWLGQLVTAKEPANRLRAAVALRELAPKSEFAASVLQNRLTDKDEFIRQLAAETLGRMGRNAESAIPGLVAAAEKDADPHVRTAAVGSLERLAQYVPTPAAIAEAVPVLTACLDDRHPPLRAAAAQALGGVMRAGADAAPAAAVGAAADRLAAALQDGNNAVRRAAVGAIAAFGASAKAAEPALLKLRDDPDDELSARAQEVLHQLLPEKHRRHTSNVVFVVDRSGSMDPAMDFVRTELSKGVNKLNPTRGFNVVWFGDGDLLQSSTHIVEATEENKLRLLKLLVDVHARGSTDPLPAMKAAFEMRPDVIYFLSDGRFDAEVVDETLKLNAAREGGPIRIHVVGFNPTPDSLKNLARLTKETCGVLRVIDLSKFQQ